jgi:hypothetical protein
MEAHMKISVKEENGAISISVPYNPDFVKRIKVAGGKWDSGNRLWRLDIRAKEAAHDICMDIYGHDGSDSDPDLVTLRVKFLADQDVIGGPIVIAGRSIASAKGRDTGAKIGDGVSFVSGSPESGGSVKNWRTCVSEGTIVDIYDVPREKAEQVIDEANYAAEIIESKPAVNIIDLQAERERLVVRIAEIDRILSEN